MMVSRKVFCGATWPLRTGIFAATLSDFTGVLQISQRRCVSSPRSRAHDAHCALRMETQHWQAQRPKFPPSCSERQGARGGSPGGSEERRAVGRRRTVRAAEPRRFQPPVSSLRGAMGVCFCPLRGGSACQVIFSSCSHTRWSPADLSSNTAARSCEADWASFPTSVAGAIVGALLGCAFLICFSFHLLSAPLEICVFNWGGEGARRWWEENSGAQIRSLNRPRWVFLEVFSVSLLLLLAVRSAGWLQLHRRLAAPLLTLCSSRAG